MNQWPAMLNIAGLLIDMIGVIGLFFTATKGPSKIKRPRSYQSIAYNTSRMGGERLLTSLRKILMSRSIKHWRKIKLFSTRRTAGSFRLSSGFSFN
ncbi:MAG: hypothetical protein WD824_02715 [Cyclobacteriaceae bacterium]